MPKCQVCKQSEAEYAFQPWGPSELGDVGTFTFLGGHYRGFPVVKVCEGCKEQFLAGDPITFKYKGEEYTIKVEEQLG